MSCALQGLKHKRTLHRSALPMVLCVQWRATKDFRDITFLGPRIVDKLALSLIIMTLYWRVGDNHKLSNYNNLAAVLFLWTILPGYAAAAFIPTIVLERPLFVRLASLYLPCLSLLKHCRTAFGTMHICSCLQCSATQAQHFSAIACVCREGLHCLQHNAVWLHSC